MPDLASRFAAALKSCITLAAKEQGTKVDGRLVKVRALERGMSIHREASSSGCDTDAFVSCSLLEMYAKCGSIAQARAVFDSLRLSNVVLWTVMIQGYADNGEPHAALDLFSRMQQVCRPNARTVVAALKACSLLRELDRGMELHSLALGQGWNVDIFVANTLIDMYAKCGSLVDARMVFDKMPHRTAVSWNSLMLGCVEAGEAELTLQLFEVAPNPKPRLAFVAALKACACLADGEPIKVRALEAGMSIHDEASKAGLVNSDLSVSNTLIDMYARCREMTFAWRVFEALGDRRSVVSWNALMLGYVDNVDEESALRLFEDLENNGNSCLLPTSRTFLAAVKACCGLAANSNSDKSAILDRGMSIHSRAKKAGFCSDLFVANSLIDMYSKCGCMVDARRVFDRMERHSAVSWTALTLGYADAGECKLASDVFASMRRGSQDAVAFVAALKACAVLASREVNDKLVKKNALEKVAELHSQAIASGRVSDLYLASTLVDLYASCGSMENAVAVYNDMPRHDVVSSASLVFGYAENGQPEQALKVFFQSRARSGAFASNTVAFVGALEACGAGLASLETGTTLHADLCRIGVELQSTVMANAVIDFYSKCGCTIRSQHTFDSMVTRDATSWTSLLAGYCRQGDLSLCMELFHAMQQDDGLDPTPATFTCLLTACSHAGKVEQGKKLFGLMSAKYGMRPSVEHYHCLLDMLGRANRVDEAVAVLEGMPYTPDAVSWRTLLAACRKWGDVELGKRAYTCLVDLDEDDTAGISLMRSLCPEVEHIH